jgi:hypothetical protein
MASVGMTGVGVPSGLRQNSAGARDVAAGGGIARPSANPNVGRAGPRRADFATYLGHASEQTVRHDARIDDRQLAMTMERAAG